MVPNSSTTMAMWERPCWNSASICPTGLVSGTTRCLRSRRRMRNARLGRPTLDGLAALLPHRQQVLVVQQTDDLLGLFVVDREARVLVLDHGVQNLVQGGFHGNRDNVVARHHDFAHREFAQIQHAVDHVLLRLRQVAEAAAGADDQLQLLRRMAAGAMMAAACATRLVMAPLDFSITNTKAMEIR